LGDYCSASCKAAQQVCYEHAVVPACTLFEETEARLETEKRTDRGMKEWCDLNEGPATKKPFLSLFPFAVWGQEQSHQLLLISLFWHKSSNVFPDIRVLC